MCFPMDTLRDKFDQLSMKAELKSHAKSKSAPVKLPASYISESERIRQERDAQVRRSAMNTLEYSIDHPLPRTTMLNVRFSGRFCWIRRHMTRPRPSALPRRIFHWIHIGGSIRA